MRVRIPGLLLAATIGLSGLLTACGDDDGGKADKSSEENTSQAETTDETEASDAGGESDAVPEAEDAAGKPARDDVVAGYAKIVKKNGEDTGIPMPDGIVNKVVGCFVDAVYDDASPTTLQALADGDATKIDPADATLFTDAQVTCQKAIS
ncbi:hypothetical protein [Pimelobacter simplex]|uniref:hypothetical protein n=1 Tax=Nocardioides simplex TaxID=2045 RepID=UPI003AADCFB7